MAQRQDKVGRLSMKALSDIATKTENNRDKSVEKTREENKGKLKDDLTKRKAKRPTREVYRPGISRLSRRPDDRGEERFKKSTSGTDGLTSDDESYRDSKESSMEKEMEGIMGSMSSLYIRGSNSLPRRGSQPLYPDPRKTSTLTYKKPEIPRYIPRAKLLEQSYKTEDKSPDIEHKDLLSPSGFNRKVDIKSDLKKMVVTVVNDQAGIVSGQSRRNHPQTLNLQFTEKSDRYYRNEDGFRSPKHRGSIDFSRDDECETPTSPGSRIYRYKFEGIRKGTDMSRDDDCDSVSSQNQRQSKRRSYTKSKHYTSHYRRQRTGSISSEFSAASDASVDDTNGGHTYDWDEEVEREMSKSVHEELREETQKLQQMTEKMENMDYLETGTHPKLSVPSSYRSRAESSGSNYSEQPQGRSRKRDRRKSSKPKTESRDSSLQSNPSKDQISSHSGDGPRRGKGRGRLTYFHISCLNRDLILSEKFFCSLSSCIYLLLFNFFTKFIPLFV
ncbi:unnamed protein product [Acanthosepion pharaonis]|uniref:Uncharacterized protein n=1 Tax=Acanthosepion pharaonis TaxID=158019 RepID=A0A812EKI9_ACAPH|nr:unnamed protein product [Sepia pharaonis]